MQRRPDRKIRHVFLIMTAFLLLFWGNAYADIAQGGSNELAVTNAIDSVGAMETLYNEFNETMDRYDRQISRCREITDPKEREKCKAIAAGLLERGKDILAKLVEQAVNIEAEIAMNKKKVGKRLAQKLDRLLTRVIAMRREANVRIKAITI
jgi:hypothetical protein